MEERLLAILRLALKYKASDIHLTSRYNEIRIQIRVNDELKEVKSHPSDKRLIRYLQYLANLDVGNLNEPQTGQFEIEIDDNLLSLRCAVINYSSFSNVVLRILNSTLKIDENSISRLKIQNDYFKSLLKKPNGLVLFSGPTGSGKTTALYALLNSVKNSRIFTIEDPIEVYNEKFVQLQVNEATGFDYASGIKQILRHDPDIILIGEIRDKKAASMALQAANTGHLVFSSIHASKASSIISRMLEFGLNEDHLYEVLLSLSNQRMMIGKNNKKIVLYEIMDQKEIEYFRLHKRNSKDFYSIDNQIIQGIKDGYLKEDN